MGVADENKGANREVSCKNTQGEKTAVFNLDIDWKQIAENLRSEHIIDFFTRQNPAEIAGNPMVIVPVICVLVALYFFKFRKLIAFFVGMCGMWVGFYYGLPEEGAAIDIQSVVTIGGTFVGVAAYWIYIFMIRSD